MHGPGGRCRLCCCGGGAEARKSKSTHVNVQDFQDFGYNLRPKDLGGLVDALLRVGRKRDGGLFPGSRSSETRWQFEWDESWQRPSSL
jgi:hypothetical protein